MIDKHFKQINIWYKIYNRKTLKISYSSTKIFFKVINEHNNEIIRKHCARTNNNDNRDSKNNNINNTSWENEWNCKTKIKCPMNGLCNLENAVYQGIIFPKENIKNRKAYIGISSTKWKWGFNNHNIHFCMNIQRIKQPYPNTFGNWKISV